MQKFLSFITGLALLVPSLSFAATIEPGKFGETIREIYSGFGEEIRSIMTDDSLSLERKFQTLSNASKARHDAAMAAIQNIR